MDFYALLLHILLWLLWSPAGKRVLFVYSNSPVWQSYIENNILPRLPHGSVVLNWSERRRWRWWSLSAAVFHFFGGSREFNPLAVVVRGRSAGAGLSDFGGHSEMPSMGTKRP